MPSWRQSDDEGQLFVNDEEVVLGELSYDPNEIARVYYDVIYEEFDDGDDWGEGSDYIRPRYALFSDGEKYYAIEVLVGDDPFPLYELFEEPTEKRMAFILRRGSSPITAKPITLSREEAMVWAEQRDSDGFTEEQMDTIDREVERASYWCGTKVL